MIYQYLLNLITSIITSRVKIFLTMGVAGLTIVNKPKTDKGKGKEIIKDGSE
jgi:ABC-type glucose/galactose transport system permease subunit